jgi:hypothetical protein
MAAGGQNGGIFPRRLADRFILSRGIFVPKGMFVAFVISSRYISLHPNIKQTSGHQSIALRRFIRTESHKNTEN